MDAIFAALLKALIKQYPGLPWASVLLQVQQLGDDALAALKTWWENAMPEEPWPGMPEMPLPHPQGPPTDDPFKP